MNIQPTTTQTPAFIPALPHKTCAHCGSVFVNETECESCNRQFNKNILGAPGGEKSFYALKARYRHDVGWFLFRFDMFLAKDASLRVRYLALLKKRFFTLLEYFNRPNQGTMGSHAYLLEFRDLVLEMQRLGVDTEYIYQALEQTPETILKSHLLQSLNEIYSSVGQSKFSWLWGYRLANGPRLSFLFVLIAAYGSVCLSALWLFSYLAKR